MPSREHVTQVQGYGARLLDRLRALRLTQSGLAGRAKVSRQTLHRAIHRDELTLQVAKRIAAVVGADLLNSAFPAGGTAPMVVPSSAPVRGRLQGSSGTTGGIAQRGPVENREGDGLTPFGEVLELLREDLGITQEEMADEGGLSVATYRRLITGAAKPKHSWLRRWAEALELYDPEVLVRAPAFERSKDPIIRALALQLRSWRATSGLDLIDVGDATGLGAYWVARFEVGDDEVLSHLSDFAHLYGTTSEILYTAARLVAAGSAAVGNEAVAFRILSYESALREARQRQKEREQYREDGEWDIEQAFELASIRLRAGWDQKDVAERIGRPIETIEAWESGETEPSTLDFERMAVLYRTTPWRLRYGETWARAWAFPVAWESRALLFGSAFSPEDRAWLYGLLAELARAGLGEGELDGVRDSLTSPDTYYDVQFARDSTERHAFLRAKLRERAEEVWRNIREPGWTDQAPEDRAPLPTLFVDDFFDRAAGAILIEELASRRARAAAARVGDIPDDPDVAAADESAARAIGPRPVRSNPRIVRLSPVNDGLVADQRRSRRDVTDDAGADSQPRGPRKS